MFQFHQCVTFLKLQIPNYHHQGGDDFHNSEVPSFFPVKLLPFIEHCHLLILVSITQFACPFILYKWNHRCSRPSLP